MADGRQRDRAILSIALESGFQSIGPFNRAFKAATGEPIFGSLSVNARAGLGSPYPRPLQAGDELQVAAASGAPERSR